MPDVDDKRLKRFVWHWNSNGMQEKIPEIFIIDWVKVIKYEQCSKDQTVTFKELNK